MLTTGDVWRALFAGVLVLCAASVPAAEDKDRVSGEVARQDSDTSTAEFKALEVKMSRVEGEGKNASGGTDVPWFRHCIVGMEVGPTGAQFGSDPTDIGYAARFNGKDIVRKAIEANSEYLVIWAKDSEYAYYNSKVAPKCPGLGDRDVLRETVDAAAPHGLPVIAYCVVQGNGYPLRDHPDYKMVAADGKPIDRICFNSGYIEHAKQVAAEMLAYGIAGFHIDMIDQGFGPPYGCWCPMCQVRFLTEYDSPMPKGVTWDADWDRMLEFRYNTSVRFERVLRAYIRSLNPNASVDFNYHGYPPFSWEVGQRPVQHAHIGDFVTGETGVWGFSALGVGLTAQFLAATEPGAPYQVAMQRGTRMYHDMTTRPVNDLRWELLTLLSHGTQVTIVDKTPYDGTLDPVTYERIGRVFAEARAKRDHFGQKPLQEVGLYYSSRSRDWYGREAPSRYQQSFTGAHKALVYEHIPVGVLLDENVSSETLRRFPAVFLSNATILSEKEVALFREYVLNGGNLLATGLTGVYGPFGEELKDCVLADLIGAKLAGILPSLDNHVRFANTQAGFEALHKDIPLDWPFLVEGPGAAFVPTTATAIGELMKPHRTVRQQKGLEGTEWPNSADSPVGPAILINTCGKGKVVYLPCSPDGAVAGEHRVVEARLMLRNIIRWLDPLPEVTITAPLNVESVVTDDEAARVLRIHLIGYLLPPASTPATNRPYVLPSLVEEAPTYKAQIEVRRPFKDARAFNPSSVVTRNGQTLTVLVDDIHDVIMVSY